MSQIQPVAAPEIRTAIARAASASGVDFDYLMAQARLESGLDPNARASTSSAAGLYQFTQGTWLATLSRHGAEQGLGDALAGTRAERLALRFDPQASAQMAAALAADNRQGLRDSLGREPDASELYLAHFLGLGGARQFLAALAGNPAQDAAALLPSAAAANRGVFYDTGGTPRSVGAVMDLVRGRMAAAHDGATAMPAGFAAAPLPQGGPIAQEFNATAPAAMQGASMAEVLRGAFGSPSAAPQAVRNAYGRLAALGL